MGIIKESHKTRGEGSIVFLVKEKKKKKKDFYDSMMILSR